MRTVWTAVKAFFAKAARDNVTGLSAMVAYSLLLSIFPLALLALFIAGRVVRSPELASSVIADLEQLFPGAARATLADVVIRLRSSATSFGIAGVVGSIWIGASFWGALDTAFCRIYALPCRGWLAQKRFALLMLGVVLVFVAATIAVPAGQSLLLSGSSDLPLGLDAVPGLVYAAGIGVVLAVLFAVACLIYRTVPNGPVPWRAVWPGALGATVAITVVDVAFPFYVNNISRVTRLGGSLVFVLITLVWFYVLGVILLAGAVANALRLHAGAAAQGQVASEDDEDDEDDEAVADLPPADPSRVPARDAPPAVPHGQ